MRGGFPSQAQTLRRALWEVVEMSGFREYNDPFAGIGRAPVHMVWTVGGHELNRAHQPSWSTVRGCIGAPAVRNSK